MSTHPHLGRGFEQTTVAEIAEQAGLTERTFFRHFADKREVLFVRTAALEAHMVEAILGVPEGRPMDLILAGLTAGDTFFRDSRAWSRRREQVIQANASLMEHKLIKIDTLKAVLARVPVRRGVAEPVAGTVVYRQAFERWICAPEGAEWATTVRQVREDFKSALGCQERQEQDRGRGGQTDAQ
jgi:AcrR family transcriptional regulator